MKQKKNKRRKQKTRWLFDGVSLVLGMCVCAFFPLALVIVDGLFSE